MKHEFEVISRGDCHERITIVDGEITKIELWCEVYDKYKNTIDYSSEKKRKLYTVVTKESFSMMNLSETEENNDSGFILECFSVINSFSKDKPEDLQTIYSVLLDGPVKEYCKKLLIN